MQFCSIMPIEAFKKVKPVSKVHMALAQYLHIPEYFKFFLDKLAHGEMVILDNGS